MKPSRELFDSTNNFDYDENDEQAFKNIVSEADAIYKNVKLNNQKSLSGLMVNSEVLLPHE